MKKTYPPVKKTVAYDPGEHRVKHCWHQDKADFITTGAGMWGKCPNSLSKAEAEILLNDAEFEEKQANQSVANVLPERAWNVHKGVIYEAVPSGPGAYHGYPWRGRPGHNRLARSVKRALRDKAIAQGYEKEFNDWLKNHEA